MNYMEHFGKTYFECLTWAKQVFIKTLKIIHVEAF